jgi:mono/diheme cytochrome c family protein
MTAARRRVRFLLAVLGAMFFSLAQPASAQDYVFMPKGGKTLLLELAAAAPEAVQLRAVVQTRRSEAQWREFVAPHAKTMSEREIATLAAYLAVNLPLPEGAAKADNLPAALPPDGRELAWNQCQSCHSLFTSYLMQDRQAQAWRNMFESPFHRQLKMAPQEREEFSRYSALNMPMKIDDVPQDLRF